MAYLSFTLNFDYILYMDKYQLKDVQFDLDGEYIWITDSNSNLWRYMMLEIILLLMW